MAKGAKIFGFVSPKQEVALSDEVKAEGRDFYDGLPGYNRTMREKKKTTFADADETARREAEIKAEYPRYNFSKDMVEERAALRLDHQKKMKKLKKRYDNECFALLKAGEFLDETEEPDTNLSMLWYGTKVTRSLLYREEVKAETKAKRAAATHERNAALVANRHLIAEEPQEPRWRSKPVCAIGHRSIEEHREEQPQRKRLHKRRRCVAIDDEAEEVAPEEAEAEDAAVSEESA